VPGSVLPQQRGHPARVCCAYYAPHPARSPAVAESLGVLFKCSPRPWSRRIYLLLFNVAGRVRGAAGRFQAGRLSGRGRGRPARGRGTWGTGLQLGPTAFPSSLGAGAVDAAARARRGQEGSGCGASLRLTAGQLGLFGGERATCARGLATCCPPWAGSGSFVSIALGTGCSLTRRTSCGRRGRRSPTRLPDWTVPPRAVLARGGSDLAPFLRWTLDRFWRAT